MNEYIHVITTVENKEDAKKISRRLLTSKLAACIQILGPLTSLYWWKGTIEEAKEWLCIIKTKNQLFSQVESSIKSIHSYDTPEIVSLPLNQGSNDYLNWIDQSLTNA